VTPDGQRFVMVQSESQPAARSLHVVINWVGLAAAAPPFTR
jgi:hypothetical protein